jgi:hypothetical protein
LISKELFNKLVSERIEKALHKQNISKERLFVLLGLDFEQGDLLLQGIIDWDLPILYAVSQKLEIPLHEMVPDTAAMNDSTTD